MSLVELLIAMAISSVVALIAFAALASTQRSERLTDDDSQALAELRTATQRLVSEMRQSGKIYPSGGTCGSTARQIEFWVDEDRDFLQDDNERIIWEVESDRRLTRRTRNDALADPCTSPDRVTHARSLVVGDAFSYNTPPPLTTLIEIAFTVDVDPDRRPAPRTIRTQVRLRSAPDPNE